MAPLKGSSATIADWIRGIWDRVTRPFSCSSIRIRSPVSNILAAESIMGDWVFTVLNRRRLSSPSAQLSIVDSPSFFSNINRSSRTKETIAGCNGPIVGVFRRVSSHVVGSIFLRSAPL